MKKIVVLLLAFCLCACMCACEKKINTEEAATAPVLDLKEYEEALEANIAKANAEYDEKLFRVTGMVVEIDKYSCTLGSFGLIVNDKQLTVYLEEDVLVTLEKGKVYTFAGTFHATSNDWTIPLLKPAVLISD